MSPTRRNFLRTSAIAAAGTGLGVALAGATDPPPAPMLRIGRPS